jgi:small-conductance mechanosensitive channel
MDGISSLLTFASLRSAAERAAIWAETHVLVWSTLLQAAFALAALLLVWLLAARLSAVALRPVGQLSPGPLQRAGTALARIAPWIVLLLLIWFEEIAFAAAREPIALLRLVESLALAWVVISLSSMLLSDRKLAQLVAIIAWIVAALNIAGLLGPSAGLLDSMAITVGTLRLSVLLVLKGLLLLCVLIWLANAVSRLVEQRLEALPNIAPAMQVLAGKLLRITLVTLAVVVALGAVGIDLTAFAVFSGAIGVGVGFGLQKVVSNLISGVILLLDRSIKPGDVIEIEGTYGWITKLIARYASVVTRDGTEFLIPNEDLITQRVVNWSYSSDLVRLRVPVGVAYDTDVRQAIRLCLDAVSAVPRALKDPAPTCLLMGFGDSSVNLELRFWIRDPRNGTRNVRSEVLLNIWDRFQAHGIEIPFPQRELTIRNPDALAAAMTRAATGSAGPRAIRPSAP